MQERSGKGQGAGRARGILTTASNALTCETAVTIRAEFQTPFVISLDKH